MPISGDFLPPAAVVWDGREMLVVITQFDPKAYCSETLVAYDGCGVKGLQMTCSALTELATHGSFPDSALSRSTECANQDKVSMGLQAALHASENVALLARALATEMIALSNAARLRDESRISPRGRTLLQQVRTMSPVLVRDRPLDADIARLAAWLDTGEAPR